MTPLMRPGAWAGATVLVLQVLMGGVANSGVITPRQLVEVVDLGNPAISPDGRMVAFRSEQASVERDTYDTVWYVQRLDEDSPPRRVAEGGVPLREYATGLVAPAPAVWSPDGHWIYYRAFVDGRVAVWRAAADGSGAAPVIADAADVRDFALSADGRTLSYSVGATREAVMLAEEAEHDRGIRIDETVFIGAGLFRSSRIEGRAATQRLIGNWFAPGPLLAGIPDRWRSVDVSTRKSVPSGASPHQPPAWDGAGGLPEPWKWVKHPGDGRIAILTRVGDPEGRRRKPDVELAVLPAAGSARRIRCEADLCIGRDITNIQWRPGSDDVLLTVSDGRQGRAQSIFRWNVETGAVSEVVRSPGLLRGSSLRFHDVPCAVSARTLVCVTAEADRPPRIEAIDLSDGRRRVLFDPNLALAQEVAAFVPARLLRWSDARGDGFTGWLFEARRLEGSPPPPLFVTYYNCNGFLRGGVGDEWPLTTMASHGITSLCVNANPAYVDATESYAQGLRAVESVVRLLAGRGEIDAARVGMGGLSHGSEVTMWTLMHSDVLSAASVSSPAITPNWYLFNSLREGFLEVARSNWQIGTVEETPERWKVMSPVFNVDRIRAPVLFQMPEQEYLVALEYALPLVRSGRADVYVFPDEPHIKFRPRHKLAAYERNLDWFRFWLQGHEGVGRAAPDHYRVWRSMKPAAGQEGAAAATVSPLSAGP